MNWVLFVLIAIQVVAIIVGITVLFVWAKEYLTQPQKDHHLNALVLSILDKIEQERCTKKAKALEALESLDDFAKMNISVNAYGAYVLLTEYIENS